jgi:hypothetical protein
MKEKKRGKAPAGPHPVPRALRAAYRSKGQARQAGWASWANPAPGQRRLAAWVGWAARPTWHLGRARSLEAAAPGRVAR